MKNFIKCLIVTIILLSISLVIPMKLFLDLRSYTGEMGVISDDNKI